MIEEKEKEIAAGNFFRERHLVRQKLEFFYALKPFQRRLCVRRWECGTFSE